MLTRANPSRATKSMSGWIISMRQPMSADTMASPIAQAMMVFEVAYAVSVFPYRAGREQRYGQQLEKSTPKMIELPNTMKISVLAQETRELSRVMNSKIEVYLSIVCRSVFNRINTKRKAVRKIEQSDRAKAAFSLVVMASMTAKEGSQLRKERVMEEQSRNIPHRAYYDVLLIGSDGSRGSFTSTDITSSELMVKQQHPSRMDQTPTILRLNSPQMLTRMGPNMAPIPYTPYERLTQYLVSERPADRRHTFARIEIEPTPTFKKKLIPAKLFQSLYREPKRRKHTPARSRHPCIRTHTDILFSTVFWSTPAKMQARPLIAKMQLNSLSGREVAQARKGRSGPKRESITPSVKCAKKLSLSWGLSVIDNCHENALMQ